MICNQQLGDPISSTSSNDKPHKIKTLMRFFISSIIIVSILRNDPGTIYLETNP